MCQNRSLRCGPLDIDPTEGPRTFSEIIAKLVRAVLQKCGCAAPFVPFVPFVLPL